MIYTSYFAKLKKLPEGVVPIAICGGVPKFYKGLRYSRLIPEYNSFVKWKESGDTEKFKVDYNELVLNNLNVTETVHDLYRLSGGEDVCLICYEKSSDFCHRHLVADWLRENGYSCEEYTF